MDGITLTLAAIGAAVMVGLLLLGVLAVIGAITDVLD